MKKILVLGAGVYQVPLIETIQRLGHKALVASIPGNYPGIDKADAFYPVNTTDIEAISALAVSEKIDAILTTGTDVCMPAIGAVVDLMGLPGSGYDASLRCMNKVLMKDVLQKASVATAEFAVVTSLSDARDALESIGMPAMVKAVDSSGSRGITRVDNADTLDAAWDAAIACSRSEEIIIERYLEGIEYGAQAFVVDQKVVAVYAHNDTVTEPPNYTPIGHSMPFDLEPAIAEASKLLIQKAVEALGIDNTVANVDLMLVDGVPYIIEIGARMGATCLPENIGFYLGCDIYEFLIGVALREKPELQVIQEKPTAVRLLMSSCSGILKEVIVPKAVKEHSAVLQLHVDVKPGDDISTFCVGPDRLGHIVVSSDNSSAAEALAEELASKIEFVME